MWSCTVCTNSPNNTSPDYYPMNLVPCGHSVCNSCLPQLSSSICPLCNKKIESATPNYALGSTLGATYSELKTDLLTFNELRDSINVSLSDYHQQRDKIVQIYGNFILKKMREKTNGDTSSLVFKFEYTFDEFAEFAKKYLPPTTNIPLWCMDYWKDNMATLFYELNGKFNEIKAVYTNLNDGRFRIEMLKINPVRLVIGRHVPAAH